jgi:hypothetical protein
MQMVKISSTKTELKYSLGAKESFCDFRIITGRPLIMVFGHHSFGAKSLNPDPDPHPDFCLDPDPQKNECGSATLIVSPINLTTRTSHGPLSLPCPLLPCFLASPNDPRTMDLVRST